MQQFKMKAIKTGLENRNILFSNIQNHESNKQLSENRKLGNNQKISF